MLNYFVEVFVFKPCSRNGEGVSQSINVGIFTASQLDGGTRPVLYKPNIQIVVYLCLATLLHYTCPSGRAGTIEALVYIKHVCLFTVK